MYGLPKDFDAGFLPGRLLEQVCFSENQVALHFSGDVSISIEGTYSHEDESRAWEPSKVRVPPSQSNLMQLLGRAVRRAIGMGDGTLVLEFDNDHRLMCFDTPQYESYHIRHGARTITV
jgi:hypothetical protein